MKRITARLIASFAVVVLGAGFALTDAQAYGGHGGYGGGRHHGGGGPGWGGVVLGTGIGFGLGYLSSQRVYGPPVYSYPPAYGWVEPPPVVVYRQPSVVYREVPPVVEYREPVAPSRPEPIIYPRSGQGPEQTEADRQACNRWATTQRNAMADSNVFNRATEACMDARGYTLR